MNTRRVYLDFQDGDGFTEVSSLVKYNSLNISTRAFNDTYHYAQNTATFSLIYESTIFTKLLNPTEEIVVRIVDFSADSSLTTEAGELITTEAGILLAIDQDIIRPVFFGRIPSTRSRTYNGIINNSVIQLEAVDELTLLDVPTTDILYKNFKILDKANPSTSIIHSLAAIAGLTVSSFAQNINVTLARFAPENEEDTILTVMDKLLYEYGWTLNLDTTSKILPISWSAVGATSFEFNDSNIVVETSIEDQPNTYDGVDLTYFELSMAEKVLVYMDDNCGFADDGSFKGYDIISGFTYPEETNVIDETTGVLTVVYQEYTDDAIKYLTNKAIKNKLDYNYEAYSSDFSSMLSTENHFVDYRADTGIVQYITPEFLNTKCRLVYKNNGGVAQKLYFSNVYADVWYRSTKRKATIDIATDPTSPFTYTSQFIYDKVNADAWTKAMGAICSVNKSVYKFDSEEDVAVGSRVRLNTTDGIDSLCFIREKSWDEAEQMYGYILTAYSTEELVLTSQYVAVTATVDNGYQYGSYTNVATPEAVGNLVVTVTPKYLGKYLDSAPTAPNVGDWYTRYSATSGDTNRGVFVWDGSAWVRTTESKYIGNGAIADILVITSGGTTYGIVLDYGTTYISDLFSMFIKILTGGAIYGGDRFNSAGDEIDTTAKGFYLGADGTLKANMQSLFKNNVIIGTDAGKNIQNTGAISNANTIVGHEAGRGSSSTVYYSSSIFGHQAGYNMVYGYDNSFFGRNAGYNNTNGSSNSFFGRNAGYKTTTANDNSFFGSNVGYSNTTGYSNSFFGQGTGHINTTGYDNSFFGLDAGHNNTNGSSNSFFGLGAGYNNTTYINCSALGKGADVTGSNQVQLGNSSTTTYVYGTVQNRSDARDKTDIKEISLGLDFIKALKPVDYKWDMREDYKVRTEDKEFIQHEKDGSKKRTRYHHGFLAQDIASLEKYSFGGYQDHKIAGGQDVLSLGYDEFIAPMVKAIQELSKEIDILKESQNGTRDNIKTKPKAD